MDPRFSILFFELFKLTAKSFAGGGISNLEKCTTRFSV